MPAHNIVAVYESRAVAEQARDRLIAHGIRREDVRLSSDSSVSPRHDQSQIESERSNEGFFAWLFGSDIDENDQSTYRSQVHGERTAVSVLTDDLHQNDIEDILDQFNPIDLQERAPIDESVSSQRSSSTVQPAGSMASTMTTGEHPGTIQSVPSVGDTGSSETHASVDTGHAYRTPDIRVSDRDEQVIPVVEEELEVGKRVRERRHRIRTHVVERPIEQDVHLRDERVVVERRPVSGSAGQHAGNLTADQGREFEIIERHEEPVVAKRARTVEEVVVKKEEGERVETIRDTVRRKEVEVDQDSVERDMTAPDAPLNPEAIDSTI
ncbi:MAG TPA: YsnF/AvaK domain-containing protein, partial [Hyphomicrobiaceae bacterium]|nr:YsnF/AvaK domain-containing protein [Hyphomicrobiaceae bacterium]